MLWRVIYPIGIHYVLGIVCSNALVTMLKLYAGATGGSHAELMKLYQTYSIAGTGLTALLSIPFLMYFLKMDQISGVMPTKRRHIPVMGGCFLVLFGAASGLFFNHLIYLTPLPSVSEGFQQVSEAVYGSPFWLQIATAGILAPIAEELVFRGLVYSRLKHYSSAIPAALVSSLLFGLYHRNVVQAVYAFCMGMLLVLACETFHSLWAPILLHMVANTTAALISMGLFEGLLKLFAGNFLLLILAEGVITVIGIAGCIRHLRNLPKESV